MNGITATTEDIKNFNDLPPEIQEEIQAVDRLEYRQFHCVQDILGYKDGKCVLCIAGQFKMYFKPLKPKQDLFEVTSYGSNELQWSWMKGMIYETRN